MNKYEVPLPQLVLIRLRSHVAGLNKKIWQDPVDLPVEVASDGGECSREEAPTLTYEKIGSDEVFAPHGWNSRWFRIPCESVRPYTACAAGRVNGRPTWSGGSTGKPSSTMGTSPGAAWIQPI